MRLRDTNRKATLGRADVHEGPVISPGKFARQSIRHAPGPDRHPARKEIRRNRAGVEGAVVALLGLWLAGPERGCQRVPHAIVPDAEALQKSADIGRLVAVEIKTGLD